MIDEKPTVTDTGPTREEMSTWDAERRLSRIQQIYIKHPRAKMIQTQMELHWRYGLRLRESTACFIVGNSRCGKSETLKRFVKQKTGVTVPKTSDGQALLVEGNGVRIVYLDAMNGATPLEASKSMLKDLFQFQATFSENEASGKVLHFFGIGKIDLLIIDEGQKMIGKGSATAATGKFANWLLSMANARRVRIIVAGGPELQDLIDGHHMIRDRKDSLQHITPFAHATKADRAAFAKFLAEFDAKTPFIKTPLTDLNLQDAFFFATRGRPGRLSFLLEKATQVAFLESEEQPMPELTLSHVAQAFDLVMLFETQMLGINPFGHDGDLPTIPQNLEQEGTDIFESKPAARSGSKGRGKGNRLYGK